MKYTVAQASSIPNLEDAVNKLVVGGYKPVGTLVIQCFGVTGTVFTQPMFKGEQDESNL